MRFDLRWVLPTGTYVAAFVIYWLFGGDFERGFRLGVTAFLATLIAVLMFYIGNGVETDKLRKCLDKYRS